MMNLLRTSTCALLLSATLAGPAWALGGREDSGGTHTLSEAQRQQWAPLVDEGTRAGLPAARMEETAAHLEAAGISPESATPLLQPAFQAADDGLPAGLILDKLDEGAAKGVPQKDLARAVEERLQALTRAGALLEEAGYQRGHRGRGPGGVLSSTALALESGVPERALAATLDRGRDKPPGLVKASIEAGEALHLAGLGDETVEALMADCLDRDLRRPEILRLVRFASEKTAAGMRGPAVRDALWGQGGAYPGRGGPGSTGGGDGTGMPGGTGTSGGRGGPTGGGMGGPRSPHGGRP